MTLWVTNCVYRTFSGTYRAAGYYFMFVDCLMSHLETLLNSTRALRETLIQDLILARKASILR